MGEAERGSAVEPVAAPERKRTLAGLLDAVIVGLPIAIYTRRLARDGQPADTAQRLLRLSAPLRPVLAQQLGTPGRWIVGLRAVDRRTGRRVALWRSLLVAALGVALEVARTRLLEPSPREGDGARERELREILAAAPGSSGRAEGPSGPRRAREAELEGWRVLAPMAAGLLRRAVSRRLAPTVVIDSRRGPSHSP